MQVTESLMYWITRMDHILDKAYLLYGVSIVFLVVPTVLILIYTVPELAEGRKPNPLAYKYYKFGLAAFLPIFVLSSAVLIFVPTTKEFAAIKVIPAIANSSDVQSIGTDLRDLAKEWMKELRPNGQGQGEGQGHEQPVSKGGDKKGD